jgi:hypothetical protein
VNSAVGEAARFTNLTLISPTEICERTGECSIGVIAYFPTNQVSKGMEDKNGLTSLSDPPAAHAGVAAGQDGVLGPELPPWFRLCR